MKHIAVRFVFVLIATTLCLGVFVAITRVFPALATAVSNWQAVDLNQDGQINAMDTAIAISYLGCPVYGTCPGVTPGPTSTLSPSPPLSPSPGPSPTPAPTLPPGTQPSCTDMSYGTYLLNYTCLPEYPNCVQQLDVLKYADSLGVKGKVGAAAPSSTVKSQFTQLPGWGRVLLGGPYSQVVNYLSGAVSAGMANDYEYVGYGPEFPQVGDEALDPATYVGQLDAAAAGYGKQVMYAPATGDYEIMSDPVALAKIHDPEYQGYNGHIQLLMETNINYTNLQNLINQVAPHVDTWIFQLGFYQVMVDDGKWYDGSPYSWEEDFKDYLTTWVNYLRTANPNIEVWTQVGIGQRDRATNLCIEPQPTSYLLNWRSRLYEAGIDGMWIMGSQSCMPCPANPSPNFPCSSNLQDNIYFFQGYQRMQDAISQTCQ